MAGSSYPQGTIAAGGGVTTPTVSLNTNNVTRSSTILTTYAVLQYNSNKTEYENSGVGNNTNTSRGLWADSGDAAGAWLARTINSGSLFSDPGSGRLNMGTTRTFRVRDTDQGSGGAQSCNLTIVMWDAASGGSQLDSVTLTISATFFDPCPTCCFTPETPVLMSDMTWKPIGLVVVGDKIQTMSGPEVVTEIITRVNRPMVRIHFNDGSWIDSSTDHPFEVKGKGAASVNAEGLEYKGVGVPKQLEIGDEVMTFSGWPRRITQITPLVFPETVYTLGNSMFYAKGFLVY